MNTKKTYYIIIIALFLGLPQAKAQSETATPVKDFNIMVNITGGINLFMFIPANDIYAGARIGMRYDFHRFWGVYVGLEYLNMFKSSNHSWHYLLLPMEMEFHTKYFYIRGGIVIGTAFNAWFAANAKEVFFIGENLGLGGRIPLTDNDMLTIGINTSIHLSFGKVYGKDNVANKGIDVSPNSRLSAGLNIGYEHRF